MNYIGRFSLLLRQIIAKMHPTSVFSEYIGGILNQPRILTLKPSGIYNDVKLSCAAAPKFISKFEIGEGFLRRVLTTKRKTIA